MFAKDGVRNMQLQHCSSKPDFVPFELPELLGLSWTPKGLQPPHVALEQMLTGVVPEREREKESTRKEMSFVSSCFWVHLLLIFDLMTCARFFEREYLDGSEIHETWKRLPCQKDGECSELVTEGLLAGDSSLIWGALA